MASLELYGRQVASGVVATPGVIEPLDVVEDIGPGLIARRIDLSANSLTYPRGLLAIRQEQMR